MHRPCVWQAAIVVYKRTKLSFFSIWTPESTIITRAYSLILMRRLSRLATDWTSFLFHWVATLGKLFTHAASADSQLQETGVQKGVFGA